MHWKINLMIGSSILIALLLPILLSIANKLKRNDKVNINLVKNWQRVDDNIYPSIGQINRWGTYCPGIYQGLKTATAPLFMTGSLLWFSDYSKSIRYKTERDESIFFEWERHNGHSFGLQNIKDSKHQLDMRAIHIIGTSSQSFIWIQRIELNHLKNNEKNMKYLLFNFGADCDGALDNEKCLLDINSSNLTIIPRTVDSASESYIISGYNEISKNFILEININSETETKIASFSSPPKHVLQKAIDTMSDFIGSVAPQDSFVLDDIVNPSAALTLICLRAVDAFSVDIIMHESIPSTSLNELTTTFMTTADEISSIIAYEHTQFDDRFHSAFSMTPMTDSQTSVSTDEYTTATDVTIEASKRILSSLLGGIGFFHGSPRLGNAPETTADNAKNNEGNPSRPISLYSATPSRTAFPRGFLWDEGFHQLVVLRWDASISMRVLGSWLNAMFTSSSSTGKIIGWIPREMILGAEGLKRVPDEFVTQRVTVANPPTLLLVVERLYNMIAPYCSIESCEEARNEHESNAIISFLRSIYPRLHIWVQGLLESQQMIAHDGGKAFRWRGRSASDGKYIANTLASGLDDYPRSLIPSEDESHLDLLCWMTKAAQIMDLLQTNLYGKSHPINGESVFDYAGLAEDLTSRVHALHWSDEYFEYLDIGMHTELSTQITEVAVRCSAGEGAATEDFAIPMDIMKEGGSRGCPPSHPVFMQVLIDPRTGTEMKRTRQAPFNLTVQHVPRIGYVCLFPLLLKLISPDSETLAQVLDTLEDPNQIWSSYGLRSLSSKDIYYNRNNAPHDTPYWRGAIWINLNYLALGALRHYSLVPGACKQRSGNLYQRLRNNLLRTIFGEFSRTGYIWEHYDDKTGQGMRGRPFTGWSALVVNILGEVY